jgi:carbonic anhydrase
MSAPVQDGHWGRFAVLNIVFCAGVAWAGQSSAAPAAFAQALAADVASIRAYALLPKTLQVAGAIYNVQTGQLEPVDC